MKYVMLIVSALCLVLAGCASSAEGNVGGKVAGSVANPVQPVK